SVQHEGDDLPASVSWFVPSLVVDLVLDAPTDAAALREVQEAAGALLDGLDDDVRVRVLTASATTDAGVDRSAARDAIGQLDPDDRGDIVTAVEQAPRAESAAPSR